MTDIASGKTATHQRAEEERPEDGVDESFKHQGGRRKAKGDAKHVASRQLSAFGLQPWFQGFHFRLPTFDFRR
jgi:hypothetical protein